MFLVRLQFIEKNEKQEKLFMDDFMLLVIKGFFFLDIVENLWMRQIVIRRDLCVGFYSSRTLIEEFLSFVMKHTFKKKNLPYVNASTYVTPTFNL